MSITLAEAQKNVQDDIQIGIIDEFRKSSYILDKLTFDDAVSPTGGGATMTYGYTRLLTQPTAGFRAINSEYTKSNVTKQRHTVDLKVFGGAFEIDRVLADMGGIVDEVDLQIKQKVKAARALFNDTFINGDSATDSNAFDGIDKAVTGSDTEFILPETLDMSTAAKIKENYVDFMFYLDKFLKKLDGTPTFIGGNTDFISVIQLCAKLAGRYQTTKDDWGRNVETYNGIQLVDFGTKAGANVDVVSTNDTTGISSLYFGRLGLDGLHGVSMAGQAPIKQWLPDFSTAGAVKTGEVEMVAAIALKASKAAGKMTNVKIKSVQSAGESTQTTGS